VTGQVRARSAAVAPEASAPAPIVITGGAGFIGRSVVRELVARGDNVIAIVRDPSRRSDIPPGVNLVAGDLGQVEALRAQMIRAAAVIHIAGMYRVGITRREWPAMLDANLGATKRVIDAAIAAGVPRIVYVSTVNVFGNTHGQVVDETYRRDLAAGFVSYYDETKFRAHEAVEKRIARGAPIIVVQPGTVYGRNDHSRIGIQLQQAFEGTLPYRAVEDLGVAPVHVDDVAAGIVLALDKGRIGESYVLAGPPMRHGEALATAARVGGHRLTRVRVPSRLLRAGAPYASRLPARLAARFGLPPNMNEVVSASDGVTYWASSAKAQGELGFASRPLEQGFRDAFGTG
jgi:nucleoside-diphosphate-sugar epimerase